MDSHWAHQINTSDVGLHIYADWLDDSGQDSAAWRMEMPSPSSRQRPFGDGDAEGDEDKRTEMEVVSASGPVCIGGIVWIYEWQGDLPEVQAGA